MQLSYGPRRAALADSPWQRTPFADCHARARNGKQALIDEATALRSLSA